MVGQKTGPPFFIRMNAAVDACSSAGRNL